VVKIYVGYSPARHQSKGIEMLYALKYREKGKEKEKVLNIEFVSNRFIKNYRELEGMINDFTKSVKEYENNINNRASAIISKDTETLKKLEGEFKAVKERVESFKDSEIFDKRTALIKYLYETNGLEYEGDDFWADCVEPSEMNRILETSVRKDFEDETSKKKALTNYMKTALSSLFQSTGDQSTAITT